MQNGSIWLEILASQNLNSFPQSGAAAFFGTYQKNVSYGKSTFIQATGPFIAPSCWFHEEFAPENMHHRRRKYPPPLQPKLGPTSSGILRNRGGEGLFPHQQIPNFLPIWGPFLDQLWVQIGSHLGGQMHENTRNSKGFGDFRAPRGVHFGSKKGLEMSPK